MFIDNQYVQAGFSAALSGLPQTANPLLNKAQPFALWEVGHTLATLLNSEDKLNNEPLERVDKSPYDQGQVAFAKGLPIVDCPYGNGDPHGTPTEQATAAARHEWRQGWADMKLKSERVVVGLSPDPVPGVYDAEQVNRCIVTDDSKSDTDSHVKDALEYASPGLMHQILGRGYRDVKPRMVPLIDQYSKQVGSSRIVIDRVDAYIDELGTVWVPPTAWAYMAACKALRDAHSERDKAYTRATELLRANTAEVERRRTAERSLKAIAEAISEVVAESDPNRV
jgi:hypothetical protein